MRPHLNGLVPDIVALNPHVGIAVFQVPSWSLHPGTWRLTKDNDDVPVLEVREPAGYSWMLVPDPFARLAAGRDAVFGLYASTLAREAGSFGLAVASAGLVSPQRRPRGRREGAEV